MPAVLTRSASLLHSARLLRRFLPRAAAMSSTAATAPRAFTPVAIVGGGPAGLTAARILQLNRVPCRVYENEAGPTARNQGGSLDLHADNGLWALEQCGLLDQFSKHSRPEGDCMAIMDKTGRLLYREEPSHNADGLRGRPEIDRLALRNLLLDSLEADTVQWGHALASLQPLPGGDDDDVCQWQLTFKNGRTERASVVIGADGAWSRVRPVLSSTAPRYSGVTFVDCMVPHVAARHPHIAAMVGPGSMFVLSDQRAIIAQMNGNDTLRTYACIKVPEDWSETEGPDGGAFLSATVGGDGASSDSAASRAAVETFIQRYFGDWHSSTMELLRRADPQSVTIRRVYALPFDHSFSHDRRSRLVTAVGDAAHVLGPNGEGVNMAMLDAAQLCLALSRALASSAAASAQSTAEQLAAAIAESERSMFERTRALADDPVNFDFFMAEDAATNFVALFNPPAHDGAAAAQAEAEAKRGAAEH